MVSLPPMALITTNETRPIRPVAVWQASFSSPDPRHLTDWHHVSASRLTAGWSRLFRCYRQMTPHGALTRSAVTAGNTVAVGLPVVQSHQHVHGDTRQASCALHRIPIVDQSFHTGEQ